MKKYMGFFILSVLTVGLLGAATVKVTKPASNETWIKGQTYAITWTKTGDMPTTVKISLRDKNSTVVVQEIKDPAPNSGSYPWLVPASVPDGQYCIRVKVKTVNVMDDSEVFHIAVSAPPPPIKGNFNQGVTVLQPYLKCVYPDENAACCNGEHLSIRFKAHTMPDDFIELDLYNESMTKHLVPIHSGPYGPGTSMPPLGAEYPNQYLYDWVVPFGDIVSPGYYRVRLHSLGKNLMAWSGKLYLTWPMKEHEYLFNAEVNNILCISDLAGLVGVPPRPKCEPLHVNQAWVGYDVCDCPGSISFADGKTPTYWRIYIHYAQLKFPIEQFQGKKVEVVQAQLRIKKDCTVNVNTNLGSCAGTLYRLDAAVPPHTGLNWGQCLGMPKTAVMPMPSNLTEVSYYLTQNVAHWIDGTQPYYGFLMSVADVNPPLATAACISAYTVKLYLKIKEEFKGYTVD